MEMPPTLAIIKANNLVYLAKRVGYKDKGLTIILAIHPTAVLKPSENEAN